MINLIDTLKPRIWLDVSEESAVEPTSQDGWTGTKTDEESVPDVGPSGDDQSDDEPETIGGEELEPLPKDVQFDILKNRRRRLVLRYAFEHENPVTIGSLAEHVAAIENNKDVAALNSRERKRAYVGLYQCHLPRMHDAGVIDFDQNRGTVSLGDHAEELTPHLFEDESRGDNYPWLYAALSTVGAGGFLISQSAIFGATAFGTIVVGLVLSGFITSAVWQLYDQERAD